MLLHLQVYAYMTWDFDNKLEGGVCSIFLGICLEKL